MIAPVFPESENPVPVRVSPLIFSGSVPEEVNVSERVDGELIDMLPKAMPAALNFSSGIEAFNFTLYALERLPAFAVTVAVWAEVT